MRLSYWLPVVVLVLFAAVVQATAAEVYIAAPWRPQSIEKTHVAAAWRLQPVEKTHVAAAWASQLPAVAGCVDDQCLLPAAATTTAVKTYRRGLFKRKVTRRTTQNRRPAAIHDGGRI